MKRGTLRQGTKPRVLVLGQTPPPFGGQAVMIQALLDGHYGRFDLVHVRMDFSHHVHEIGQFQLRKVGHLFWTIIRIVRARIRQGCTTLYYPPAGPNLVPICRDIAILLSTRWMFRSVILHFHASGVSEADVPAVLRPLYRLAYSGADAGIRLSELTPDDPGAFGAAAVHLVPNGVPDYFAAAGRRAGPADHDGAPVVLYVGVLSESKGLLLLLEACALLKKAGVRFRLLLVGAAQPAAFSSVLADAIHAHELGDDVQLCGVRFGEEKWLIYSRAAIFCFPTSFESEAFPVVLLEAMQFALPVVATAWRGIPSIVEDRDTGFLVPPGDAVVLAERMETLLGNPELAARMGQSGRDRYLRCFTIDAFQRKMEAVIGSVIGSGAGR